MRQRLLNCVLFLSQFQIVQAQEFRVYNYHINDICYSQFTDKLYAASSGVWSGGNAVLVIDPATGAITESIACGSEPTVLALSDNGQYLYIGLRGAPIVRRYDLIAHAFSDNISIEEYIPSPYDNYYPIYAGNLVPLPGQAGSVLVGKIDANSTPEHYGLTVFDDTAARTKQLPSGVLGSKQLAITENGQTVWGMGHDYELKALTRYTLDLQGVTYSANFPTLLTNGNSGFSYKNGRIYANTGQIFDVSGTGTPVLVQTIDVGTGFGINDAITATSLDSARFYIVSEYNPADPYEFDGYHMRVFDMVDNKILREYTLPEDFTQRFHKMISLGKGRLALLSRNNFGNPAKLVLLSEGNCPPENLNLSLPGPVVYACVGDTVKLQGVPGYTEYFWSNGVTGPTIDFSTNQMNLYYRVRGANGCLSAPSNTISVIFEQRPSAPVLSIPYLNEVICPDETATITGYSPGGNAAFFALSTGDTLSSPLSYAVVDPGKYSAVALSLHGCASLSSEIEVFAALPPTPVPTIEIVGSTATCDDQLPTLTAPAGAWEYEWSNGAKSRSIQPQWSGGYAIKILYENGCGSRWSDTVDVEIKYTPAQLTVKKFGQHLYVDNFFDTGDSLQWYLNGQPVIGANDDTYIPQEFGIYSIGNFSDGCAAPPSLPFAIKGGCQVSINAQPNGVPANSYTLMANALPTDTYEYVWLGGSTTSQIEVTLPATYCVTVTRASDGCIAFDCISLDPNTQIAVAVTANGQPTGDLWVTLNEWSGGQLEVRDTLTTDSSGMVIFENVTSGYFALQAIPPLNHSLADSFFPTYYIDGHQWQQAEIFQHGGLKLSGEVDTFSFSLLQTIMLSSGPGVISGLVTETPGFMVTSGADNFESNGEPLANVEMLLFRDDNQIALYTFTDGEGKFMFAGLPYGTYYVYINLQGTPVVYAVVVLSPDRPAIDGLLFEVADGNVAVGTKEFHVPRLRLWPNPVAQMLYFEHTEPTVDWIISNALGQILLKGTSVATNSTQIAVAVLPSGIYSLQVTEKSGAVRSTLFLKE